MIHARPIYCSFCHTTTMTICDDPYTCKTEHARRENQARERHCSLEEDPLAEARGVLFGLLLSLPLCALLAWALWAMLGVIGWR